jgi:hydrogenase expression/formation protein HypC
MCLAVPGEILSIEVTTPLDRAARVSFGGLVKSVSTALLPEAEVGHYVLVHAGVAISIIDAEEAQRTFEYLKEIEELDGMEEGSG